MQVNPHIHRAVARAKTDEAIRRADLRRADPGIDQEGAVEMHNAEVVLSTFRAVETRDAEGLFALYHDEIEFSDAPSLPYGGTHRGKETLWRQLTETPEKSWLGTWGPLQPTEAERRMTPRVVAAAGDEVTVIYTQRGVSPDGESYEGAVMGLYEVREERFARARMFHFDTAALVDFLRRAGVA